MAPAGAVGLAGAVGGAWLVVGAGPRMPVAVGAGLSRGVGKAGSVGPVPGSAIGLPSMIVLQPPTSTITDSTQASRAHRA